MVLVAEPRQFGTGQQGGTARTRTQGGDVAEVALGLIEHLFAALHFGVVHVATGGHTEGVEVEIDVLHVLGGDFEPTVGQSHRTGLRNLRLSLRNLFGVATVGHTHVAGETEFDGEVGVLRLIARKAELIFAALEDIIGTTGDAVFGIVAFARQGFDFFRVEGHHLSHADVAQRNTYGNEEIFGANGFAVGAGFVPVGDGVGRSGQFVGFAVGEGALS